MWGAIGAIGAAVVGSYTQSQTNSANAAIAQASNTSNLDMFNAANRFNQLEAEYGRDYNSAQAAVQRDWSSSQASTARDWSSDSQSKAEGFNAAEAQKNRDWQQQMSETSWQRAVGDMKNAGLNPMLAYSQGGAPGGSGSAASVAAQSASAPGGASASGGNASSTAPPRAQVPSYQSPAGTALSSGLSVLKQAQELDIMKATEDKLKAETPGIKADSDVKVKTMEARVQDFFNTATGRALDTDQKEAIYQEVTAAKRAEAQYKARTLSEGGYQDRMNHLEEQLTRLGVPKAKAESEFFEGAGQFGPYIKMLSDGLSSAGSISRVFKGSSGRGPGSYSDTHYDRLGNVTGGRSRTYAD